MRPRIVHVELRPPAFDSRLDGGGAIGESPAAETVADSRSASKSAPTTAPPGTLFQVPVVLNAPVVAFVIPVLAPPGTRKAKPITLRPFTGRLTICLVSIVPEIWLEVASTTGASPPATVTVSVVPPSVSFAMISVTRAVWTSIDSYVLLEKPDLEIVSL